MMTPMAQPSIDSDQLRGDVVRGRISELGMSLRDVSAITGIPQRTLHNTTRRDNPDRMRHHRVVRLARALKMRSDAIVDTNDGVPDEPPQQPRKNTGPVRRKDTEDKRTGPRRTTGEAA